jgi:hypothetical protein
VSQYIPNPVPFNSDASGLGQFLQDELSRIATALNNGNERAKYLVLYGPPDKYEAGDTVYADGTSWNPGSGEGKYRRNKGNTAWVFEG